MEVVLVMTPTERALYMLSGALVSANPAVLLPLSEPATLVKLLVQ